MTATDDRRYEPSSPFVWAFAVSQMAGWIVRKLSDYSTTGVAGHRQQVQLIFEC